MIKIYIRNDKAQDYHNILSHAFKEMKDIRDSGDMALTLYFGMYCKHEMIDIPVIQLVIEDYKGIDLFCGRKGSYYLNINGLYYDCDIYTLLTGIIRALVKNYYVSILLKKI